MRLNYSKNRAILKEAWYDFFILGKKTVTGVNNLIMESWIRSKNSKIDCNNQYILEHDQELRKKSIEKNCFFIDISKPYIHDLYNIIDKSNFSIVLVSKDGYVLDSINNPKVTKNSKFKILNLSEDRVGTNAFGTCLYLDSPVQTWAEEHCYKGFHDFTTSAAPIHDSEGSLIGCIGITGFTSYVSLHTMGMATALAYAIENKIKVSENRKNSLFEGHDNIFKKSTSLPGVTNSTKLYSFEDILGDSQPMKDSINFAKIASKGSSNVLLIGESGTGKELFAQSIHNNSNRKNKPFVDINCGALPLSLAESELFGYEGGSYTGSKKEGHAGKFEMANGGTLFLDEIGELPLSLQAALLRVIQERKITRIGSSNSKDIDIMIIAATNRNLFEAVHNNTFRADLFYRLNVFNINLPPLREHKEDIPLLVDHFIKKYNKIFNIDIKGVSDNVLEIFKRYNWPGNIREMENVIERAVQIAQTEKLEAKDLPVYLKLSANNNVINKEEGISIIQSQECEIIVNILKKTSGNASATSNALGISRATLYRKLLKYGISINEFRGK